MNELSGSQLAVFGAFTIIMLAVATGVGTLWVRAGFPVPSGERRIGCVDGLRGYLALSVMAHHFSVWTQLTRFDSDWELPHWNILRSMGSGGVALFFMTTGLVFYPRVRSGFVKTSWVSTYTGRIFRIVPLVAFSVIAIMVIISFRQTPQLDWSLVPAVLKWLSSWSEPSLLGYPDSGRMNAYVLWSLRYEWIFYLLVLPICALGADAVSSRLPRMVVPIVLLVASLAVQSVVHPIESSQVGFGIRAVTSALAHGLPTYLPCFAIGMLANEVQAQPALKSLLARPWIGALACIGLFVGMVLQPDPYGYALPFYGFFFICVACGNSLGGLLRTRGALALGECSYGIYLLHGIALSLLFVDGSRLTAAFGTTSLPVLLPVAGLAISCVTPLTYLLIERPAIQAGSRLGRWLTGRRVPANSPQAEIAP